MILPQARPIECSNIGPFIHEEPPLYNNIRLRMLRSSGHTLSNAFRALPKILIHRQCPWRSRQFVGAVSVRARQPERPGATARAF